MHHCVFLSLRASSLRRRSLRGNRFVLNRRFDAVNRAKAPSARVVPKNHTKEQVLTEMLFAPRLPRVLANFCEQAKKELDMITSVIVNYNSAVKEDHP